MRIRELLDYVDDVKPNAFTDAQKLLWINELEARIQRDVFLSGELIQYRLPGDETVELLLDPPHDAVYRYWLEAMIDYANGEYNKYQNTMQMFNAQWSSFVCWFAEMYRPADGYAVLVPQGPGGAGYGAAL